MFTGPPRYILGRQGSLTTSAAALAPALPPPHSILKARQLPCLACLTSRSGLSLSQVPVVIGVTRVWFSPLEPPLYWQNYIITSLLYFFLSQLALKSWFRNIRYFKISFEIKSRKPKWHFLQNVFFSWFMVTFHCFDKRRVWTQAYWEFWSKLFSHIILALFKPHLINNNCQ